MRPKKMYDLYDNGVYAGSFTADEVAEKMGINKKSVYRYAFIGCLCHDRWEIREGVPRDFAWEWNEACNAVRRRFGWK